MKHYCFIVVAVCLALAVHSTVHAITPDQMVLKSIQQRDQHKLERLMKSGYNVNAKDIRGQSALEYGVRTEIHGIVKFLLDNGANVNSQNNIGQTPLMHAVGKDNLRITKLLLNRGSDVNIRNNEGITALGIAAFRASKEIRDLLHEAR